MVARNYLPPGDRIAQPPQLPNSDGVGGNGGNRELQHLWEQSEELERVDYK
jgi:hypothetical protein